MRIYGICLGVFLCGIVLWLSGLDMALTLYLDQIQTPFMDRFWRFVGQLGLGRWQLWGCLGLAWWCTRQHRQVRLKPLSWGDIEMLWRLFNGALFIWLRALVLKTSPVVGTQTFFHRSARYCQQLPWRARVWLYAIPTMFAAGALCTVLKMLVGRPRPKMMLWHDITVAVGPSFNAKYFSFPSGHTTTTFALLAVLQAAFPKYGWVWWPVACLTAFARVGAITPHFLGDVAAGAAIGYGVGYYFVQQYRLSSHR